MLEFAEISGLSRPTIAKYFSDPDSVRKSTRQKIEQALKKYDYRPNLFAVNLNKKSANIIGVIIPDSTDPFYANLIRFIELNCAANGYLVIALSSRGDPGMEARAVDTLLSLKIAGAIIAPLGVNSELSAIDSLRDRIPLVLVDSRLDEETPFVGTDNSQSMSLITDYLCRTGERPCFFELPAVNMNGKERRDAYIRTMEEAGLQPEVVSTGTLRGWRFEDMAYAHAQKILAGTGFPTKTVLCVNDRVAVGVMAAAFEKGLKVGRDQDCHLRIAGHDDHPASRYCCPPLTTVAQDVQQIGAHCVDMLLSRLDGGDGQEDAPDHIRLEAKLMMRSSA